MLTCSIVAVTVALSILCFRSQDLFLKLSLMPYRVVKHREFYRLVTHGFIHADWTHLFVNMFTLWSFGYYMEQIFDYMGFRTGAWLLLYMGGMLVATTHDLLTQRNNPYYLSIGASGAVSAVMFASIFLDPWGKIYLMALLPLPSILFGVIYLIYCQYMARQAEDNVNHYAHFYGALYGFLFPALLHPDLISQFWIKLIG